jgi:hypothetical protein
MRTTRASTRTWLAVAAAGAVAAAVAGRGKGQGAPPTPDTLARVAQLQRATRLMERQVTLADGKEFYLVLDPAASDLTLMLNGAELRRHRVLGLQVGQPRVAWFTRRDPRPWQDVVWAHGELDPPRQLDRLVIQAAPPGKDAAQPEAPPIPQTPEELYPVPARYRVRFDDGLSIEVRPLDTDTQAGRLARLRAWWSVKWNDGVTAAFGSDRDALRVRIAMSPEDAASLYRSLPPSVRLIILPGSQPRR